MQSARGSSKNTGKYLTDFINTFLKPYYEDSVIVKQRSQIRKSPELNKLLFDNLQVLELIFEKMKSMKNLFNLNSAKRLLIKLRGREFKVNDAKIE